MLFFSCQEVDFPKVTHTVSNRSTEAMAMPFKSRCIQNTTEPSALWQHLLALSSNFINFLLKMFVYSYWDPAKKNASIIIGKNFQLKSMQTKGFPQPKQSTTAISRVLIANTQFRESEVEKKCCEVKSQWHSYSSKLSYVDSVKNSVLNFPCHSNPLLLLTTEGTRCAVFFLQI